MMMFTYGTLLRGFNTHKKELKGKDGVEFVGKANITGKEMYAKTTYPVVVEGDGVIYGEVYKIENENVIARIDALEEGAGYERVRETATLLDKDKDVDVMFYRFRGCVDRLPKVETGDWREFSRKKRKNRKD